MCYHNFDGYSGKCFIWKPSDENIHDSSPIEILDNDGEHIDDDDSSNESNCSEEDVVIEVSIDQLALFWWNRLLISLSISTVSSNLFQTANFVCNLSIFLGPLRHK